MPPKTAPAGSQTTSQSSGKGRPRAAKETSFPAQTLAQMTCHRARKIASALKIKDYAKVSWPSELGPLIREAMAKNLTCEVCGGGPCNPETHQFPATNPYVDLDDLGNPIVEEVLSDDEQHNVSGGLPASATVQGNPDRDALHALTAADQPHDQVVALSENAPGFIQSLQDSSAPGSSANPPLQPGSTTQPKSANTSSHNSGSNSSSVSSEEPVDSEPEDLDNELAAHEEFQKELEELRLQHQTELNTRKNAKEKKKRDHLTKKQARKEAEAQKQAQRKIQLEERRKQILAEMIAKHQEELAAADDEEVSSDDDEVFAKPSGKGSTHSSRSSSKKTKSSSKRVSVSEPARAQSARPASESDPAGGLTLASVMEMMDRQHRNTLKVVKTALSANKPSQVPVSELDDFGHASSSCANDSGRAQVILPGNPDAAKELGLNPPLNLAFQGKVENIDISKVKKTMTSGKNRSAQGLVLKQVLWPHDCISKASRHILGYSVKVKHDNQNFAMFNEGMSQMMLLDTPRDKMDPILMKRLRFQSFIIRQSYVLDWKDCLVIIEDFFDACEHANMSWDDDWSEIERFLKASAEQIRLSASYRGRANSAPAGGNPQGGGQSGKRFADNANGVPTKWMIEQKICVAFNLGYCPNQKGGDHATKNNVTLRHWCGGCFKKSNGAEKHAHPASTCPKGPFNNLFG